MHRTLMKHTLAPLQIATLAAIFAIALLTGVAAPTKAGHAQEATDAQRLNKEQVETIIRDYLLENPEVLLEALQVLERRQQQQAAADRQQVIDGLAPRLASLGTPTVGPEDGDVVFIEFFDYNCGYCKRLLPSMKSVLADETDVTFYFVEFPILHETSRIAARAALAAQKQERYMDMHLALMELRGTLSEERILDTASSLGLDVEQLRSDMDDPAIGRQIALNHALAEELGVGGTPSMVIGGEFVGGFVPEERLRALIDAARAES